MTIVIDQPYDYLEVVITKDNNTYDVSPELFEKILQTFAQTCKTYKYFQSDYKEYIYRNTHMIKKIENDTVTETKVYMYRPVFINNINNTKYIFYERKKISSINFPSKKEYDTVIYKRKMIFRINNKIYVNFQQEIFPEDSDKIYHKIFINFNNHKDSDLTETSTKISSLLNTLIMASTSQTS